MILSIASLVVFCLLPNLGLGLTGFGFRSFVVPTGSRFSSQNFCSFLVFFCLCFFFLLFFWRGGKRKLLPFWRHQIQVSSQPVSFGALRQPKFYSQASLGNMSGQNILQHSGVFVAIFVVTGFFSLIPNLLLGFALKANVSFSFDINSGECSRKDS